MYRTSINKPSTAYRLLCSTAAVVLAVSPIAFTPSTALAEGHGSGGESSGGSGGDSAGGTGQKAGSGGGSSEDAVEAAPDGAGGGSDNSGGSNSGGSDSGGGDNAGGGTGGPGTGGPGTGGGAKGDLFGDLVVILRDADGIPVLNDAGFVQPIDANGDLIPLDEEGMPIDPTLVIPVDLGRTNVARTDDRVLETRTDEVVALLTADNLVSISQDAAGRLVLTDSDGVEKTIDSPLDNLAIYTALLTTGSISTLTPDDLVGTDFDFMVDGEFTIDDLEASVAFLSAATDKTSPFTSDEIAYLDAFLGINTVTVGDVTYSDIDYSSFDYDRSDTYDGVMVDVLVYNDTTGTWDETNVDIYTAVFADADITVSGSLDAYTQAAEDARLVIEFIHEYAVPE